MSEDVGAVEALTDVMRALLVRSMQFRSATARDLNIGLRDNALLAALVHSGGQLTARAAAAELLVSSGTLTAITRRLEDRRLVLRTPDPDDRRGTLITLQPAGRRATQRVRDHLRSIARTLVADADADTDLVALARYLRAVTEALSAEIAAIESEFAPGHQPSVAAMPVTSRAANSRRQPNRSGS